MAVVHLNNDTFHLLLEGEKPVLAEFWAPWCIHCRNLEDTFEQISNTFADRLNVGKINIDDCPELAERYFIDTFS